MDAADFLEPDELAALARAPVPEAKDACDGCAIPITWTDAAFVCSFDCTWCPDCAEASAMACPNCSGELRRRAPLARPLPVRRAPAA